MSLETNFNAAPYFDDFNANNNFHRVLFKPSVAVQARELTQLQTILQDQIDKFGRHIFKYGSIVEGCTINFNNSYDFVKIQDTAANGEIINVTDFIGSKLVSSSNLQAVIVNAIPGRESEDPDLNTLYIKYLNSANYANGAQQKRYDPSESLVVQTTDNVSIANVTIVNALPGNSNAVLNPTGIGYAVSITEGTIFDKGFFISVKPQTLVVSKYTAFPDKVSVGFEVDESVVVADADPSLYDNALGYPNFGAPGANRLKLSGKLSVRATDVANNVGFLSIVNFEAGKPIIKLQGPQYSNMGAEIARRTFEESGNYIVNPFELSVASNTTSPNNLILEVSRGLGYVQGYRVEFGDTSRANVRKGIDTVYFPNQIITANYGNYIFVQELAGPFDTNNLDEVGLYATAATKLTLGDYTTSGAAPSTQIGTAKVRSVEYFSGVPGTPTCQYKVYLFDINITSGGYSFSDVRSLYATDGAGVAAYADAVLDGGVTVLRETSIPDIVFDLGRDAVQTINTTSTSFIYKTKTTRTFQANGTAALTPPTSHPGGTDTIAVTGSLSEANEARFIVIANTSANAVNVSGVSVSVNTASPNVTGNAVFTSNFAVGDYVAVGNSSVSNIRRVVSITNTTHMVVNSNFSIVNTAFNIARHFPAGVPIPFNRDDSANVSVALDGSSATLNLGTNLATTFVASIYYDVFRNQAVNAGKTVNKNRFVKIQVNTHPTGVQGPWSLGLADVIKVRGIYQGTTYSTSNPERSNFFTLDNGQRGSHYDLSTISLKPGTNYSIGNNDVFLVELDHLIPNYSAGIGYFSVRSYPIDDANTANTSAILTQEIPLFTSTTGVTYDLRDCIDFRPYVNNTANSSNTIAGATVNPVANTTLFIDPDGAYAPSPDQNFNTAFSYYLGRKDKVTLSSEGRINIVEGTPATSPISPRDLDGTMTLGVLTIPPYPSLSQADVRTYKRADYGVTVDLQQNRRYTMRDIGVIDKKLARLEYYTTLSLLEASAKTLNIKDASGIDRFKNGFIVDPFKGFSVSDTKSEEFKAAIDIKLQELSPMIKRTYVDLDFDIAASTNMERDGALITLVGNTTPYIEQNFASKVRNCVENIIYVWNGRIDLTPEGDAQPDIDINPDVVGNVDLSGLTDFINGMPNLQGLERVVSTAPVTSTVTRNTGAAIITDVVATTTDTTLRTDIDYSAATVTNTFEFGEVVQDVSIQPFIRARRVGFTATGLKPNTRMFAFFDNQPVSEFCTPIVNNEFSPGAQLISDATGTVTGFFDIPAGRFKTGDKVFRLCDVANLTTSGEIITTQASATYSASNISITKAKLALNTRVPQISQNQVTVDLGTRTSARTISSTVEPIAVVESNFDPVPQPPDPGPTPPEPTPPAPPLFITVNNEWEFFQQILATAGMFDPPPPEPPVPPPPPILTPPVEPEPWVVPWEAPIADGNGGGGDGDDPIAQTFVINEIGNDTGVFIKKIDLFFKSKHPTLGVEVQIREVDNGSPTLRIVPFGRKTLESSEVNVSENASVATTFEFNTPVFLRAGMEYCFVVKPVGSNDGYNIWVAELGGTDIQTGAPIFVNNSTGVLFTSSTNRIWTPFQKEDIKFVLHRKNFTALNGTAVYKNSNNEYLSANNFGNNFIVGERVYVSNGTVTIGSNAVTNSTSNVISVIANGSVNAQALFTNSSYIYISSNTGSITDVRVITGIPNATHLSLNAAPSFTDGNCSIGYLRANGALFGFVSRVSKESGLLFLERSSANSTVGFGNVVTGSANAILIGGESTAKANLVSVDDIKYSVVIPQFAYVAPSGSSLTIGVRGVNSSVTDTIFTVMNSDIETFFTDRERIVRSFSNEQQAGGIKSVDVRLPVTTNSFKVSPYIDDIKTDLVMIENMVGPAANVASEIKPSGGTIDAKYVSKRVALADGQDAEDLLVYLTAYKPSNTNITVFAKFLNGEDSEPFGTKWWTPLNQLTPAAVVSSRIDRNDFKEFIYDLPVRYSVNAASNTAMADYAIYGTFSNTNISSNTITLSNSSPLEVGSLVYYIGDVSNSISNGFFSVLSANTTALRLATAGTTNMVTITAAASANTGSIYVVPQTAFKDRYTSNVVSYYTNTGAHLHSYKTFSIKIAMTSEEGSHITPRVSDMRAIALQV